jgi:hypothetical protein
MNVEQWNKARSIGADAEDYGRRCALATELAATLCWAGQRAIVTAEGDALKLDAVSLARILSGTVKPEPITHTDPQRAASNAAAFIVDAAAESILSDGEPLRVILDSPRVRDAVRRRSTSWSILSPGAMRCAGRTTGGQRWVANVYSPNARATA